MFMIRPCMFATFSHPHTISTFATMIPVSCWRWRSHLWHHRFPHDTMMNRIPSARECAGPCCVILLRCHTDVFSARFSASVSSWNTAITKKSSFFGLAVQKVLKSKRSVSFAMSASWPGYHVTTNLQTHIQPGTNFQLHESGTAMSRDVDSTDASLRNS